MHSYSSVLACLGPGRYPSVFRKHPRRRVRRRKPKIESAAPEMEEMEEDEEE